MANFICRFCGSKKSICLEGVEALFCDNYKPAPEVEEITNQLINIIDTTLDALDTPRTKNVSDEESKPSTGH